MSSINVVELVKSFQRL